MPWTYDYLIRAQHIANMQGGISSPDVALAWASLEDDILGKLSIEQARELWDFVIDIPCQGSLVIMQILEGELE